MTHPSDVLRSKWCVGKSEDGSVSNTAIVEVGRPCKLSCDPVLIREGLEAVLSLFDAGKDGLLISGRSKGRGEELAKCVGMELRFSTGQVSLELLPAKQGAKEAVPTGESSQGPSPEPRPPDGEGALVDWDSLQLSVTCKPGRPPSAVLTVGGAQLLSRCGNSMEHVVLPTELELAWHKNLPSSPLDRYVMLYAGRQHVCGIFGFGNHEPVLMGLVNGLVMSQMCFYRY